MKIVSKKYKLFRKQKKGVLKADKYHNGDLKYFIHNRKTEYYGKRIRKCA